MIEVTAAIIVKCDKVLLAKRGPGKHLGGYWEFPGGKIEKNETY
jgi:8-oxo-dGTP pyrophosphatase MutT (NUDIX family)